MQNAAHYLMYYVISVNGTCVSVTFDVGSLMQLELDVYTFLNIKKKTPNWKEIEPQTPIQYDLTLLMINNESKKKLIKCCVLFLYDSLKDSLGK